MRNRHSSHPVNPLIGVIGVQTIIAAALALAITFTLSCSSPIDVGSGGDTLVGNSGTFTDDRDGGKVYKWVKIGSQVWMAENLNYKAESSKCFGEGGEVRTYDQETDTDIYTTLSNAEVQTNCTRYGRLYDWNTAKAACPKGWHLPSRPAWNVLATYIESNKSCTKCDAKHLKTTSGWDNCSVSGSSYSCLDSYGFSALPGGYGTYTSDGTFNHIGDQGHWWSASETGSSAIELRIYYDRENVDIDGIRKGRLYSVRCLKD
jgi:uncharacterized protein (TIGR02145 family)